MKTAKGYDLHTAIETCGYAKWTDFQRMLKMTDVIIYDLKHMSPTQHMKYIGVSNILILKNLTRIVKQGKEVLIRIPLIPGINDTDDNFHKTAEFIKSLGEDKVEFIPYHEFASTKYDLIGRLYTLHKLQPYTSAQLEQIREKMDKLGVKAIIGV
jgi:pyruvate formate lyase activating enzyme